MDYKKIFNKISVGNKAREESGFAPAFINSSLEISDKFGTGLSFRDGNPPIPFGQFKPMSLKTKTASMGVVPMMTARKIVIDRDLHRAGSKDVPDKYKDIKSPKLNLRPSQNKGSLRLLFSDPHIEITEINDKGELFYRMRDVIEKDCHNPDAAKNTVYKINLKKPMDPPPLTSKQKDALRNTFRGNLELAAPPREWLDKLIEFNALDLDKEYHTFYQKERGQDFQKEMVVGNPPFSGDADMFSVSIPIHLAKTPLNKSQFIESPEDIEKFFNKINKIREIIKPRMQQKELAKKTNKILNRHKRKNQEAFIYDESQFGRLSFFVEMHMPSETVLKIIDDLEVFLRTDNLSGLATQYEFIVGAAINRVAGNTAVGKMIKDMILHGPETNNPNHPSSLDDKILHFYEGEIYMTHSELELVAFYMETSYLENNFQPVHPEWNMDLWHDVISKQIKLGQADLINPKTMKAYIQHSIDNGMKMPECSKSSKKKFITALHKVQEIDKDNILPDYMKGNNLEFTIRKSKLIRKLSRKFENTKDEQPIVQKRKSRMSTKIKNMMELFSPTNKTEHKKKISGENIQKIVDKYEKTEIKDNSSVKSKVKSKKIKRLAKIFEEKQSTKRISKTEFLEGLQSKDETKVLESILDYIRNNQNEFVIMSESNVPMNDNRLDIINETDLLASKINERDDLSSKEKVEKILDMLSEQRDKISAHSQNFNENNKLTGLQAMQKSLVADKNLLNTYDDVINTVQEAYEQQYSNQNNLTL